jgi:hypothetical protein
VKFGRPERTAVILGAADGLTLAISEIMGLRHHQPEIFLSGLSAGLGELVGMTAALWLSAGDDKTGFIPALGCGIATLLGCVLPCAAYTVLSGAAALAGAAALIAALGAMVCWVRPQKGIVAAAETYGVLAGAGLMCYAASFVR